MKYFVIMHVSAPSVMASVEGVLEYHRLDMVEGNRNYRVFSGEGNPKNLSDRLNMELAEVQFDIEDSIFVIYPMLLGNGRPSLSTTVIKRKGNRELKKTIH